MGLFLDWHIAFLTNYADVSKQVVYAYTLSNNAIDNVCIIGLLTDHLGRIFHRRCYEHHETQFFISHAMQDDYIWQKCSIL